MVAAPPQVNAQRWLVAIVMIGAVLMDMIDLTVVNVALPTIRADLHASPSQIEWVISAYMLGFAAVLVVAGSFGGTLGRRSGCTRCAHLTSGRSAPWPIVPGLVVAGAGLALPVIPLVNARRDYCLSPYDAASERRLLGGRSTVAHAYVRP